MQMQTSDGNKLHAGGLHSLNLTQRQFGRKMDIKTRRQRGGEQRWWWKRSRVRVRTVEVFLAAALHEETVQKLQTHTGEKMQ